MVYCQCNKKKILGTEMSFSNIVNFKNLCPYSNTKLIVFLWFIKNQLLFKTKTFQIVEGCLLYLEFLNAPLQQRPD